MAEFRLFVILTLENIHDIVESENIRIQEVDTLADPNIADMPGEAQYLLVDAKVLPEAFHKVVKAKQLLAQGKAKNLSDATKAVRISRSAFYKYKDSVYTWHNTDTRQIATLTCELADETGVLSSLLEVLSAYGANVLTINQNIPVDSVAPVSISMRTGGLKCTAGELTKKIKGLYGVVSARILSN